MAIFTLNGFCHFLLLQNFVKKTGLKMAIFYIKCLLPFFAPEFCLQKWGRKWQIFILNGLSHFLPQNFVDKNRVENGRFLSEMAFAILCSRIFFYKNWGKKWQIFISTRLQPFSAPEFCLQKRGRKWQFFKIKRRLLP